MKTTSVAAWLLCVFGAGGLVRADAILIDHNCVDVSTIPAESIAAAASLRVLLRHASVGQGIGWGLDCLAGLKSNQTPCKCFAAGVYDRSRWVLEARLGDGKTKIDDLVTQVETRADQFDVFMMKYCYIDALGNSHPDWDYYRSKMEQLEAQYPAKRFVWWTIPLTRDGQPSSDVFNALVRSYCTTHGKILFDIADIECHDPDGARLTNAQGNETIAASYTNEIHAGHLNIEGRIRVASALWRLMAAVAEDLREPPGPRIIYVDDDANAPGDGSSWATAYRFLQDALADANEADEPVEIQVAQGVYKPDRDAAHPQGGTSSPWAFQLSGDISLRGGFAGLGAPDPNAQDAASFESILAGDLADNDGDIRLIARTPGMESGMEPTRMDNTSTVVEITGSGAVVLEGFTVTGGFISSRGGIASMRYGQCGGGVLVYSHKGEVIIRSCHIKDNFAEELGGGIGICVANSVRLTDCTINLNVAAYGGGLSWMDVAHLEVLRCAFAENWAWEGGAVVADGAATGSGPRARSASVSGCVFSGNEAYRGAGGFLMYRGDDLAATEIANCTFEGNAVGHPSFGIAVWAEDGARVVLRNSILRNNRCRTSLTRSPVASRDGTIKATYCNIEGGWPGAGNIDGDPLYARPGYWDPNGTPDAKYDDFWVHGDYHLKSQVGRWDPETRTWANDDATSPCINAGDPNSPVGEEPLPNGGRVNMGAYGGTAEASRSPSGG